MAVVTATGMETEIGRIAGMMNDAGEKKTPLQISLDQFGSRLAAAILVVCLAVFFLSINRGMAVLVPDLQACRDKLSAFLQEQ